MTAFDLIDSIFSRVQREMPGNVRLVTPDQVKFLYDLIGADPEGGHVEAWYWPLACVDAERAQ